MRMPRKHSYHCILVHSFNCERLLEAFAERKPFLCFFSFAVASEQLFVASKRRLTLSKNFVRVLGRTVFKQKTKLGVGSSNKNLPLLLPGQDRNNPLHFANANTHIFILSFSYIHISLFHFF